ncbi:hypothetical protein N7U66_01675 [Lacinutrix neustonica]|uniref:Uncharacterized protein n=1 Tax=Lacinutrix neustonica TaxID=2980107 RepID=A0A9E8SDT6_9FLAO|nr:hypothetical protein [Lacinutrix neustonica]WAC02451.1 hypothetical protein N7U66_01675 [Lacinutrix neustonica]
MRIKIVVKMDPNHSGPVNGFITCALRHPNLFTFQDGKSTIVIPFNSKTNEFSEEFGTKIKFKNANATP